MIRKATVNDAEQLCILNTEFNAPVKQRLKTYGTALPTIVMKSLLWMTRKVS